MLLCTCPGDGFVAWMTTLHTCAYTAAEQASLYLGLINIAIWIIAQMPQIITTFQTGNAGALSFTFIFTWLAGDTCNLLGCFFTKQTAVQTLTAVYFCSIDVVMISQWSFFTIRKRKRDKLAMLNPYSRGDPESVPQEESTTINPTGDSYNSTSNKLLASATLLFIFVTLCRFYTSEHTQPGQLSTPHTGRTLLEFQDTPQSPLTNPLPHHEEGTMYSAAEFTTTSTTAVTTTLFNGSSYSLSSSSSPDYCNTPYDLSTVMRVLGDICAWSSGLLYFFGRVPQVYHNWKRKSVEGLSPIMFACAVLANICYSVSILLLQPDWSSPEFWESKFPYLLGSLFTLVWPAFILCQFAYYGWWRKRKFDYRPVNE
ncbi:PQ loop repeat protein [Pelomyxa schiedti]|nr:PQ loop repeat protein [Pelomyxa schiedti]